MLSSEHSSSPQPPHMRLRTPGLPFYTSTSPFSRYSHFPISHPATTTHSQSCTSTPKEPASEAPSAELPSFARSTRISSEVDHDHLHAPRRASSPTLSSASLSPLRNALCLNLNPLTTSIERHLTAVTGTPLLTNNSSEPDRPSCRRWSFSVATDHGSRMGSPMPYPSPTNGPTAPVTTATDSGREPVALAADAWLHAPPPQLRKSLPVPRPRALPAPRAVRASATNASELSVASSHVVGEPFALRDLRRVTAPPSAMDPWVAARASAAAVEREREKERERERARNDRSRIARFGTFRRSNPPPAAGARDGIRGFVREKSFGGTAAGRRFSRAKSEKTYLVPEFVTGDVYESATPDIVYVQDAEELWSEVSADGDASPQQGMENMTRRMTLGDRAKRMSKMVTRFIGKLQTARAKRAGERSAFR